MSDNDLGADILRAEVPMPDGVTLVADLWPCPGVTTAPVVFERTPYGRARTDQAERLHGADAPMNRAEVAAMYHAAGCHYLVQDCRGSGASGGSFSKYLQERGDGLASLAWIRAQGWCDGRIAMVGFSYGAACQLATLFDTLDAPDAAILDCGGFSDALTSGIRQGGALLLKQATWALAQAIRDARAAGDNTAAERLERIDARAWLLDSPAAPGSSPLSAAPDHQANLNAMWQNGIDGPYWDRPGLRTPAEALGQTPTRCLLVTSWNDTSLIGTLENHAAMTAPAATCPPPALIIGPWTHGDRWSTRAGDAEFGPAALPEAVFGASLPALRRDFVAAVLEGEAPAVAGVHYFEIGGETGEAQPGGCWKQSTTWPPAPARPVEIALPGDETADLCILSDPTNPVPTLGGAINSGGAIMPGGMMDQALLDTRDDILRFNLPGFDSPRSFAGPVRADIWIIADVPDLDIAAKLCLVLEDGRAFNISDGLCRARHRTGVKAESFLAPGEPTLIPVRLNPVAFRIMPKQSLRLDIAGSNFPCFDINPQTGARQGFASPKQPALIRILTGGQHRSTLTLTESPT